MDFLFGRSTTENYWEKKANNDPANIKMGIGRCGRIIGALADWHDCEISSLPSSHWRKLKKSFSSPKQDLPKSRMGSAGSGDLLGCHGALGHSGMPCQTCLFFSFSFLVNSRLFFLSRHSSFFLSSFLSSPFIVNPFLRMDLFKKGYSGLLGAKGQPQSATDTVDTLVDRVLNSTLIDVGGTSLPFWWLAGVPGYNWILFVFKWK